MSTYTWIHDAARQGDVDAMTRLLAIGVSPNQRLLTSPDLELDRKPLHQMFTYSIKLPPRGENYIACFELLLRHGADVNATDRDGATALLYLTAGKAETHWVERFINAGADVRMACEQGTTPLHYAASRGDCDAVRLLIRAGAALDVCEVGGGTPLQHAITGPAPWARNNQRICSILLRAGAPLPDLSTISDTHPVLPYLRKVRAAGSFTNYERLHIDKLTRILTPRRGPSSPLRRVPTEIIRKIVVFAFHAGFYVIPEPEPAFIIPSHWTTTQ